MSYVDHWWCLRSNPGGGHGLAPFGITALRRLSDPSSRSDDLDFFLEDSAGDELPDLDLNTLDWYEARIPIAAFGLTFAQAEIGRLADWNDPKFVAHEREREKRISSAVKTGGGWKSFLGTFPVIATMVDGRLDLVDGWHRLKLAQKGGLKTTTVLLGVSKPTAAVRTNPRHEVRSRAELIPYLMGDDLARLATGGVFTQKHLFAANERKREGYFLVQNKHRVLDRKAFREIVEEAKRAGLKTPYHVFARISTYSGPNIDFLQIGTVIDHGEPRENPATLTSDEDDLWGLSNEGSAAITGESARILRMSGYRAGGSEAAKIARAYLDQIVRSRPTKRRLYSGHAKLPVIKTGEMVKIPLTALSDDEDFARTFATGEGATLLHFAPGIRAMKYSDSGEWITAGDFSVKSVKTSVDPFWKTPLRIVTLDQR